MEHVDQQALSAVHLLVSDDAGATFRSIATYQSASTVAGRFVGDVTVAASNDGDAYFAFVDYRYDASSSQVMLTTSHDHGMTWGPLASVPGTETSGFEDRPWLTVDPTSGDVDLGMASLLSNTSGAQLDRRSHDHSATWSSPVTVCSGSVAAGGAVTGLFSYTGPAIAADGETLFAAHKGDASTGAQTIELLHGTTSFVEQPIAPLAVTQRSFPRVVAGPQGMCVANLDETNGRLFVRTSTDGSQFSPAIEVDDAQTTEHITQPWMAMSDDGRCELVWLQGVTAPTVKVKAASVSLDGARSAVEIVGDANIDEVDMAHWAGDYISIATRASTRYAVWTGAQAGHSQVYFSSAILP
jgi:hypothetical protein